MEHPDLHENRQTNGLQPCMATVCMNYYERSHNLELKEVWSHLSHQIRRSMTPITSIKLEAQAVFNKHWRGVVFCPQTAVWLLPWPKNWVELDYVKNVRWLRYTP